MIVKMAKDNYNHTGEPGEEITNGISNDTDEVSEEDALDIEHVVQECSNGIHLF